MNQWESLQTISCSFSYVDSNSTFSLNISFDDNVPLIIFSSRECPVYLDYPYRLFSVSNGLKVSMIHSEWILHSESHGSRLADKDFITTHGDTQDRSLNPPHPPPPPPHLSPPPPSSTFIPQAPCKAFALPCSISLLQWRKHLLTKMHS